MLINLVLGLFAVYLIIGLIAMLVAIGLFWYSFTNIRRDRKYDSKK